MNPEPDIETRTDRAVGVRGRGSRAPWDPPPKPAKPKGRARGASGGGDKLAGADAFGYDDNIGRGAD